jgi:hypothetical protein
MHLTHLGWLALLTLVMSLVDMGFRMARVFATAVMFHPCKKYCFLKLFGDVDSLSKPACKRLS